MSLGRSWLALAGLAILQFALALPERAAAQAVSTSERVHVVWEDPPPGQGQARMRLISVDDQGTSSELRLSAGARARIGNPMALDRQYVRIVGTRQQGAPDAIAASVVYVQDLFPAVDPLLTQVDGANLISGSVPWVTVLCRFSDSPSVTPHPASWYQQLMGSSYPGMDDYWREVSFNTADVAGSTAVGWYDLPQPKSAYMNGSTPDLTKLKQDCAAAADPFVFFPDFAGINFQFNETIGCCSWGGSTGLAIDGQAKTYRATWMAPWAVQKTYAHEMGHGFGLPHSSGPYGNVYDSDWDVMSRGRGQNDPSFGWVAPHTIARHKDGLGWIPAGQKYVAVPGSSQTIRLHRLADPAPAGDYSMAEIPLPDGNFYTVETRRFLGYDQVPGEAVVIHHVDVTGGNGAHVVDVDGDGNPNDDGAMWLPGEVFTDAQANVTVRVESSTSGGYVVTIDLGGTAPPPAIALTPSSLTFSTAAGSDPPDQSFSVQNSGGGTLDWTATADQSWLSVAPSSGSLAAGATRSVTVSVASSGLSAGTYMGTVTVSGTAGNSPQMVDVTLTVTAPPPAPTIALNPASLVFSTTVGSDPPDQSFSVQNSGGGTLDWAAASNRNWLSVAPSSGSLAAGATRNVTVSVAAAGLSAGTHAGTITVSGNAGNSPQTIDVSVTVNAAPPAIALSPSSLSFSVTAGSDPPDQSFTVQNSGGGTLDWSTSSSQSWLSVSPSSGSLAGGATRSVTVNVVSAGLNAGTYNGTISVSGNAGNSPQSVTVNLTVTAAPTPPAIALSPSSLSFSTTAGSDPPDQSFTVQNSGGGSLDWSAGNSQSWLGVSPASGSLAGGATRSVTVSVAATGLSAGTYADTITVSGNAGNSPQSIPVTLTVSAPPTNPSIAANPRSLTFRVKGGKNPKSQQFELKNAGGGTLNWSASDDQNWLSLATNAGSLGGGAADSVSVSVSATGLAPGTYTATIAIAGNAGNSPQTVTAELRLSKGAVMKLNRNNLTFAASSDESPMLKSFVIENTGDDTLVWTASADVGWINLGANSGSVVGGTTDSVTVAVSTSQLSAGTHAGTITLSSADNGPQTIDVSLTLRPGVGVSKTIEQVAAHLLDSSVSLSAAELTYLDQVGNGDGGFDLGDLRAWLIQRGVLSLIPDPIQVQREDQRPQEAESRPEAATSATSVQRLEPRAEKGAVR